VTYVKKSFIVHFSALESMKECMNQYVNCFVLSNIKSKINFSLILAKMIYINMSRPDKDLDMNQLKLGLLKIRGIKILNKTFTNS